MLEAAVGTGKNLPHYPEGVRVVGLDLSREMLARARERAGRQAAAREEREGVSGWSVGGPDGLDVGGAEAWGAGARGMAGAGARGRGAGPAVLLVQGDSAALPFPDATFDTVVDSLTVCTYPDPVATLRELARVCRPGGRLLLLEHGRSSVGWIGRLQDRQADRHARTLGCRWNREPLELVREAGLVPVEAERSFLGVFHRIVAQPGTGRRPLPPNRAW